MSSSSSSSAMSTLAMPGPTIYTRTEDLERRMATLEQSFARERDGNALGTGLEKGIAISAGQTTGSQLSGFLKTLLPAQGQQRLTEQMFASTLHNAIQEADNYERMNKQLNNEIVQLKREGQNSEAARENGILKTQIEQLKANEARHLNSLHQFEQSDRVLRWQLSAPGDAKVKQQEELNMLKEEVKSLKGQLHQTGDEKAKQQKELEMLKVEAESLQTKLRQSEHNMKEVILGSVKHIDLIVELMEKHAMVVDQLRRSEQCDADRAERIRELERGMEQLRAELRRSQNSDAGLAERQLEELQTPREASPAQTQAHSAQKKRKGEAGHRGPVYKQARLVSGTVDQAAENTAVPQQSDTGVADGRLPRMPLDDAPHAQAKDFDLELESPTCQETAVIVADLETGRHLPKLTFPRSAAMTGVTVN